jgi:hypothetical protein
MPLVASYLLGPNIPSQSSSQIFSSLCHLNMKEGNSIPPQIKRTDRVLHIIFMFSDRRREEKPSETNNNKHFSN